MWLFAGRSANEKSPLASVVAVPAGANTVASAARRSSVTMMPALPPLTLPVSATGVENVTWSAEALSDTAPGLGGFCAWPSLATARPVARVNSVRAKSRRKRIPLPPGDAPGSWRVSVLVFAGAREQDLDLLEVRLHTLLHRVQDLARARHAVGGDRELLADAAALLERALRALELAAHRGRVQALGLALGHQHAGAREQVGELQALPALVGVVDDEDLVAVDLAQRLDARGQLLLGGHDPDRVRSVAVGHRLVELGERDLLRRARVLGLEDDPPARRARAAVDRDHDVALAAADARQVADRVAVVARAAGDRVHGLEHRLLVRAALGGRALVLGGDLERLLALGLQLRDLHLQRADALVHLAQVGVLLVGGLADRRHRVALERGERVGLVGRGELAEQPLARLVEQLGHRGLDLVLDGGAGVRAEVAVQHARDMALLGAEGLLQPRPELGDDLLGRRAQALLDLVGGLLEVGAQHLDARARLLAVQHAGADLDRVGDHARGILAGVDRAPDQLGGDRVVDHDVLDDQPADERVDAGAAEWRCGFHEQRRRLRASADVETGEPLGLLRRDVERVDLRVPRAGAGEVHERGDGVRRPLEDRLDRAVGAVAHPAGDAAALGLAA